LDGVVGKLSVLKRKSNESLADELEAANVCKKRLEHLKDYCVKSGGASGSVTNEAAVAQWKKKRLDRMLVDHFLRSGYYDSAINLALRSQIESLTNIDLFLVSRQVEDSLRARETYRCLSWCHDNKSKLRKIKSSLEMALRQQEFIELVRKDRRLEAVRHARKHFNNADDGQQSSSSGGHNADLQRVMGLLAFPADTPVEPYRSLFDESRWDELVEQFRTDNFRLYQLSSSSVFSVALQAGLSSLKTPHCYKKDGERNGDCPVCSQLLNKLAAHLPCAHCSQSRLVCYISGQPLNEHNQPLVLPNGYVYGEQSLRAMAAQNGGRVTCPRTREVFDVKEADKVFVM
jgi:macrophage erythroblast attacher